MATIQTTIKQKPYFLTDDERLDVGSQIAEALDRTDALQSEKESFAATHKAKEKDLSLQLDKLRKLHRDGFELRDYKCNVFRNSDTHTVDFVAIDGDKIGEVIDQRPWNNDDWSAHLNESQLPLFGDEEEGTLGDEQDLKGQADLTAEGPVQPNTENGYVIAGPNTDAYNKENPGDTTYQHLSQSVEFTPAPMGATDVDRDDEHDLGTPHSHGGFGGGPDKDTDDDQGDDSDGGDDEDDSDDDSDDDAPKPTNLPKRKAKRRKDAE